jgi:hypothetical protein
MVMKKTPPAPVDAATVLGKQTSETQTFLVIVKRVIPIAVALTAAMAVYRTKEFYEKALGQSARALHGSLLETNALRLEMDALSLAMHEARAALELATNAKKELTGKLPMSSAEVRCELDAKLLKLAVLETDLSCARRELGDLISQSASEQKRAKLELEQTVKMLTSAHEETVAELTEQHKEKVRAMETSSAEMEAVIGELREELRVAIAAAETAVSKNEQESQSALETARSELTTAMDAMTNKLREESHSELENLRAQYENAMGNQERAHAKTVAEMAARIEELTKALQTMEGKTAALQRSLNQSMADSASHEDRVRRLSELAASIKRRDTEKQGAPPLKNNLVARQQADIPVKFTLTIDPGVTHGKQVGLVGTWNDWSVENVVLFDQSGDGVWSATQPIRADDMYEYKYVLVDLDNNDENDVQWQFGNNKVLALQLALREEVVLVEVRDSWKPDPKTAPIILHSSNGTVRKVGSTQLLRECVAELRTEHALLLAGGVLVKVDELGRFTDPDGDGPMTSADVRNLASAFGADGNASGRALTQNDLAISDREIVTGVVVESVSEKAAKRGPR